MRHSTSLDTLSSSEAYKLKALQGLIWRNWVGRETGRTQPHIQATPILISQCLAQLT